MSNISRFILLATSMFIMAQTVSAHAINYTMEQAPGSEVWLYYGKLGYLHILPYGLDHILFVVGLCLLSKNIKVIAYQATAFTIAHSITLALSLKGIIAAPPAIVEPIIALSIAFIAVENIMLNELKSWRVLVIFLFGLIHGMGFASSLNEIGLPRNQFLESVAAFNVGVELGQLTIILVVYEILIRFFGQRRWYRQRIVFPLSALIAVIAVFWTIERIVHMA
ncbi:MAG TPA: HupE/UreJ family protein [Flavitalea sp.]|nr:HupE/UreJ family protein [Flavitalea sp.]